MVNGCWQFWQLGIPGREFTLLLGIRTIGAGGVLASANDFFLFDRNFSGKIFFYFCATLAFSKPSKTMTINGVGPFFFITISDKNSLTFFAEEFFHNFKIFSVAKAALAGSIIVKTGTFEGICRVE